MAETPFSPDSPESTPPAVEVPQEAGEVLDKDDLPEPWHGSIAPAEEPSIAASLEVPPLPVGSPPADGESGGEWEMLTAKVRQWFGDGEPQKLLDRIGGPLKTVAYLLALLLLLRVYRSVVGTIDGIPLVSGLLELVGLIALVRFCLLRLVRRSEREKVLGNLQKRWDAFRGTA